MERIGHRGAKRELPENTLAAFARAFERGADAVELDVHATTDGVVVVHHDPTVRGIPIARATWDEVSRLDVGQGHRVPTLAAVLAACPPDKTVYVEIKGTDIEAPVVETIRRGSARTAIHSFDHHAIETVARLAPEIPRGLLFERDIAELDAAVAATGARDVWPHWRLVDDALVQRVHALGGRVIVWTVNHARVAHRMARAGVDGLCGDDVRLLQVR